MLLLQSLPIFGGLGFLLVAGNVPDSRILDLLNDVEITQHAEDTIGRIFEFGDFILVFSTFDQLCDPVSL